MALRLNVPAMDAKPATTARIRLEAIDALISSLPQDNDRDTARLLLDELDRLNRQPLSVALRIQALERYRPAIFKTAQGLSRHYGNQSLPLPDAAASHANLALHLFGELAIGYKQAILNEERRLFTIGDDKQRALLIQRAIDALSRQLRVHYLTYSTPLPGIWSELHLLYLLAAQLALQNLPVTDGAAEGSIDHSYKQALLLAIADPSQLHSLDIERAIAYLEQFADLAQLLPLGHTGNTLGIFLVNLQCDKPPIPLDKNTQHADPGADILLVTIELARQVHHHLSQLKAKTHPPDPAALPDQNYLDVLQHLLRRWGNPPKRGFQRADKNNAIHMCMGVAVIYHFLDMESSAAPGLIGRDGPAEGKSETWSVINESPGGLALRKLSPVRGNLRIGELVGLKTNDSKPWGLAIVRRASSDSAGPLQIGVQMIAPSAKKVILHLQDSTQTEFALLLPELTALKQTNTIITTRGLYQPARTLRLEEDGKMTDIMLTSLVERTHNFERFQFSRL